MFGVERAGEFGELLRWRGEGDGETTTRLPAHVDSRLHQEIVARYVLPRPLGQLHAHPSNNLPDRQECMPRRRKKALAVQNFTCKITYLLLPPPYHRLHKPRGAVLQHLWRLCGTLAVLGGSEKACTKPSVFPEADPERKHPTRIMARVRPRYKKSGQRTCESRSSRAYSSSSLLLSC
jgi:hypothetical protein